MLPAVFVRREVCVASHSAGCAAGCAAGLGGGVAVTCWAAGLSLLLCHSPQTCSSGSSLSLCFLDWLADLSPQSWIGFPLSLVDWNLNTSV